MSKMDSLDLTYDDGKFVFDFSVLMKKAEKVDKPKRKLKAVTKVDCRRLEDGTIYHPEDTYLVLPDGTYYVVERKEAIQVTDAEIQFYAFHRWGLLVARDMKIYRGHVQ